MLANLQPNESKETSAPVELPPEMLTEIIEKRIRQLYADWADKPLPILGDRTPRKAIQTPEGLETGEILATYLRTRRSTAGQSSTPRTGFL
jgi:hypothetical protein